MQNTFDKNELNAHVNVSVRLLYQRRRLKMKKRNIAEIKRENKLNQTMLKRAITVFSKKISNNLQRVETMRYKVTL